MTVADHQICGGEQSKFSTGLRLRFRQVPLAVRALFEVGSLAMQGTTHAIYSSLCDGKQRYSLGEGMEASPVVISGTRTPIAFAPRMSSVRISR